MDRDTGSLKYSPNYQKPEHCICYFWCTWILCSCVLAVGSINVECMFFAITTSIGKRLWTWTEQDTVKQSTSVKLMTWVFSVYIFKMKNKTFSSLYTASVYLWVKVIVGVKSSSCSAKTVNVIVILAVQGWRPHAVCCQCNVYFTKRPNEQLWIHILCWFMLMWWHTKM